ncbi:MAG: hypothetical protein LBS10_07075 [Gracilibacteraceae bacterium]|jgi:tetratricopeptide (TPR) repeat protein|nr:hypothetical protein [Gracilibacteraceae bacterium]
MMSEIWQGVAGKILGVAVIAALALAVVCLLLWLRRRRGNKVQDEEVRDIHYLRKMRREELGPVSSKVFRELLDRYIPHDLVPYSLQSSYRMDIDAILNQLATTGGGFVFVGEVGAGKSSLLQHMAYSLGQKMNGPDGEPPYIFCDLADTYALEPVLRRWKGELASKSGATVFIDNFDRSGILSAMTVTAAIDRIVYYIQTELAENVNGLVIATRPDVLPPDWSQKEWLEFGGGERVAFSFFRLCPLSERKIRLFFQRVSPSSSKYGIDEYLVRMKPSIFAWPMALDYADQLLQGYGITGLRGVETRAETLKRIIYLQFKREYFAYKERPGASVAEDLSQDDYVALAQDFVWKMIRIMLNKNRAYILKEEIESLDTPRYKGLQSMAVASLMRQGLRERKRDGVYTFVHLAFFELLVASYLLNEAGYEEQSRWLHHRKFSGIRLFYYELLRQAELVPARLWDDLSNWRAVLPEDPGVTVEEVAIYWPFVDSVRFQQYYFEQAGLQELVLYGEVDFSDRAISNLKDIEKLGRVEYLDVSGAPVRSLRSLLRLRGLKGLDARNTEIPWHNNLLLLEELPLDTLAISTNSPGLFEKLIQLPLRRIFIETTAYSDLHLDIWRARQSGRFVAPTRRTRLEEMEKRWLLPRTVAEIPILSAVFELEWECFDKIKNADVTYWNAMMLASCLYNEDKTDKNGEGYELFRRLLPYLNDRTDQLGMQYHYQYGLVLFQRREYEEALFHWKLVYESSMVGLDQKVRDAVGNHMVKLYWQCGRQAEAEQIWAELTLQRAMVPESVEKNHLDKRYNHSAQLLERKDYEDAEDYIRETLQMTKRYEGGDRASALFWQYHLLVVLYSRTNRVDMTQPYFEQMEALLRQMEKEEAGDVNVARSACRTEIMKTRWWQQKHDEAYMYAMEILAAPNENSDAREAARVIVDQYQVMQRTEAI